MRPLNQAVPGAIASLLGAAPLSPGKVAFAWRAAVGPAMDRGTAVRLEAGVLLIDAMSPQWAHEMTRSSGIILARMQKMLGAGAVERLQVRS